MLTSSTGLQNRSFYVGERTRTSSKCQKLKNARCKNPVFHRQICKFVGFLLPSSSWMLKLPINRSQMTSKYGKNKKWHTRRSRVSLMFLLHFDVLCDLLLNRCMATWNLFVLYNRRVKYTEKMPFCFKFRHFVRHENSTDVILCLRIQNEAN